RFLASCGTGEVGEWSVFSSSQEGRWRFRREDQAGHVLLSNHMGVACLPIGQPLFPKEGPRFQMCQNLVRPINALSNHLCRPREEQVQAVGSFALLEDREASRIP